MGNDLKDRTKRFALSIIDLVEKMDYSIPKKAVANQLVRAGTSVGANYRAACRSRSNKEFISKLNIVLEEIDECSFWLEIIKEKNWCDVDMIYQEADELTAITVASLKTMNQRYNRKNE